MKENGKAKSEKVRTSLLFAFSLLLFTSLAQAAVLDKTYLSADRLSFKSTAEKMKDRNVMLALGRCDHVVPLE